MKAPKAWKACTTEERLLLGTGYGNKGGFVFVEADGTPPHPDRATQRFEAAIPKTLPRIRLHDLRHTHATQLLLKAIDTKTVSERLGHASVQITMDTYMAFLPELDERAADVADLVVPVVPDGAESRRRSVN